MQNTVLRSKFYPDGQEFNPVHGDLTQEKVGAIVNAANEQLLHGGGIAAAIARAGGKVIDDESRAWVAAHGPIEHARPAYTAAGDLPCKYVIHAVGPVWGSGDEETKLTLAIRGCLLLADEIGLQSIAIPAISTGIFGFPKEPAAQIIYQTVQEHLTNTETQILEVRMTVFDQPTVDAFTRVWDQVFTP